VDTNVVRSLNVPIDPLLGVSWAGSSETVDVDALYRTHRPRLVALASAITLDRDVAEEVVQDAFVGLQRHAADVDRPLGYLQRSVVNGSISAQRRRRVAADHVAVVVRPSSIPEIDETWAVVRRLPPRQRAVVVLRFWEDMTVDAISRTLGWPAGSVMSTLHRALKRLKEEIR
jgi:RNA polymerase sigma factor (sigma-70 family)